MSDFVQKHFVSATNVSQFAQPKKHHGQQCVCAQQSVLVYQGLISHPWGVNGLIMLLAELLKGFSAGSQLLIMSTILHHK